MADTIVALSYMCCQGDLAHGTSLCVNHVETSTNPYKDTIYSSTIYNDIQEKHNYQQHIYKTVEIRY